MVCAIVRTTVWAVRDAETKDRISYRYRSQREAAGLLKRYEHTGRVVELYRTTQNLPRHGKRSRGT